MSREVVVGRTFVSVFIRVRSFSNAFVLSLRGWEFVGVGEDGCFILRRRVR